MNLCIRSDFGTQMHFPNGKWRNRFRRKQINTAKSGHTDIWEGRTRSCNLRASHNERMQCLVTKYGTEKMSTDSLIGIWCCLPFALTPVKKSKSSRQESFLNGRNQIVSIRQQTLIDFLFRLFPIRRYSLRFSYGLFCSDYRLVQPVPCHRNCFDLWSG